VKVSLRLNDVLSNWGSMISLGTFLTNISLKQTYQPSRLEIVVISNLWFSMKNLKYGRLKILRFFDFKPLL
ncbi:MAG: hypothetical protein LZ167_08320, partial [Thaumarchaeota archaeon]|nr:hypothetical protein [Candidatus Geocrenenecus arthurdayi]